MGCQASSPTLTKPSKRLSDSQKKRNIDQSKTFFSRISQETLPSLQNPKAGNSKNQQFNQKNKDFKEKKEFSKTKETEQDAEESEEVVSDYEDFEVTDQNHEQNESDFELIMKRRKYFNEDIFFEKTQNDFNLQKKSFYFEKKNSLKNSNNNNSNNSGINDKKKRRRIIKNSRCNNFQITNRCFHGGESVFTKFIKSSSC